MAVQCIVSRRTRGGSPAELSSVSPLSVTEFVLSSNISKLPSRKESCGDEIYETAGPRLLGRSVEGGGGRGLGSGPVVVPRGLAPGPGPSPSARLHYPAQSTQPPGQPLHKVAPSSSSNNNSACVKKKSTAPSNSSGAPSPTVYVLADAAGRAVQSNTTEPPAGAGDAVQSDSEAPSNLVQELSLLSSILNIDNLESDLDWAVEIGEGGGLFGEMGEVVSRGVFRDGGGLFSLGSSLGPTPAGPTPTGPTPAARASDKSAGAGASFSDKSSASSPLEKSVPAGGKGGAPSWGEGEKICQSSPLQNASPFRCFVSPFPAHSGSPFAFAEFGSAPPTAERDEQSFPAKFIHEKRRGAGSDPRRRENTPVLALPMVGSDGLAASNNTPVLAALPTVGSDGLARVPGRTSKGARPAAPNTSGEGDSSERRSDRGLRRSDVRRAPERSPVTFEMPDEGLVLNEDPARCVAPINPVRLLFNLQVGV